MWEGMEGFDPVAGFPFVFFFFFFECFRFLFSASVTMFIIREGIRAWRLLLHPYEYNCCTHVWEL